MEVVMDHTDPTNPPNSSSVFPPDVVSNQACARNFFDEYTNETFTKEDMEVVVSTPASVSDDFRRLVKDKMSRDSLLDYIWSNVIGNSDLIPSPFGSKKLTYADYTASGRALEFIEQYIHDEVLPLYANTHTTTDTTGLQTTLFRHEAREIVKRGCRGSNVEDTVLFCGSGSTSCFNSVVSILNLKERVMFARITNTPLPVIITGPMEHHSNLLPWRESGAIVFTLTARHNTPFTARCDALLDAAIYVPPAYKHKHNTTNLARVETVEGHAADITAGAVATVPVVASNGHAAAHPYPFPCFSCLYVNKLNSEVISKHGDMNTNDDNNNERLYACPRCEPLSSRAFPSITLHDTTTDTTNASPSTSHGCLSLSHLDLILSLLSPKPVDADPCNLSPFQSPLALACSPNATTHTQPGQMAYATPLLLSAFSAGSNVTGALEDTLTTTAKVKKSNGLCLWDYAACGPYVPIDMNPHNQDMYKKDFLILSVHKFVGGVATPGVMCVKKKLLLHPTPHRPGGGTVLFVSGNDHTYLSNFEEREEGGTPDIVGSIRAGLAFQLRETVTAAYIHDKEERLRAVIDKVLGNCPFIHLLGVELTHTHTHTASTSTSTSISAASSTTSQLPIISFAIRYPHDPSLLLHHNFISALLNDLFGIQSRAGCACAGPYVQASMGIGTETVSSFLDCIYEKQEVVRPGMVRVNLSYFSPLFEIEYILKAIQWVAVHGWKVLPLYTFVLASGEWKHVSKKTKMLGRRWLGAIKYSGAGMCYDTMREQLIVGGYSRDSATATATTTTTITAGAGAGAGAGATVVRGGLREMNTVVCDGVTVITNMSSSTTTTHADNHDDSYNTLFLHSLVLSKHLADADNLVKGLDGKFYNHLIASIKKQEYAACLTSLTSSSSSTSTLSSSSLSSLLNSTIDTLTQVDVSDSELLSLLYTHTTAQVRLHLENTLTHATANAGTGTSTGVGTGTGAGAGVGKARSGSTMVLPTLTPALLSLLPTSLLPTPPPLSHTLPHTLPDQSSIITSRAQQLRWFVMPSEVLARVRGLGHNTSRETNSPVNFSGKNISQVSVEEIPEYVSSITATLSPITSSFSCLTSSPLSLIFLSYSPTLARLQFSVAPHLAYTSGTGRTHTTLHHLSAALLAALPELQDNTSTATTTTTSAAAGAAGAVHTTTTTTTTTTAAVGVVGGDNGDRMDVDVDVGVSASVPTASNLTKSTSDAPHASTLTASTTTTTTTATANTTSTTSTEQDLFCQNCFHQHLAPSDTATSALARECATCECVHFAPRHAGSKKEIAKLTKKLCSLVGSAIMTYSMIKEGDRVLVGVSGGKDSLTLVHILRQLQKRAPISFQIGVCTVDPQAPEYDPSLLKRYFAAMGVPYHYESQAIMAAAKKCQDADNKISICAFCSRMRRGILYNACRREGYNVLALGQHLDDLSESFVMSAFFNGMLRTMKVNYMNAKGDIRIIRPLCYVRESKTREFAKVMDLPIISENCPACFEAPKERQRVKLMLAAQENIHPMLHQTLLRTMKPLMGLGMAEKSDEMIREFMRSIGGGDDDDEEEEKNGKQQQRQQKNKGKAASQDANVSGAGVEDAGAGAGAGASVSTRGASSKKQQRHTPRTHTDTTHTNTTAATTTTTTTTTTTLPPPATTSGTPVCGSVCAATQEDEASDVGEGYRVKRERRDKVEEETKKISEDDVVDAHNGPMEDEDVMYV